MEIVIIAVVVIVGALIYFNRQSKSFDINKDGKVDAADARTAVNNAVQGVKAAADVNKDGKVDAADVKVTATKAKTAVKKAAVKAKSARAKKKAS